MAYSGGVYTKPVQSGVDNLSQLYLQGRMQVVNMREKVRKERSNELAAFQKAASEIEATSIAEADKLYQKGADDLRTFIGQAHNDNILQKITRSQATARINNYISQASQLANATKIVASKVKQIDEGIAKDDLSKISKDEYLSNWFSEDGGAQTRIKVDNEKGGYDLVPKQTLLSVEPIGDQLHFKKTFNFYDENTKKIEVGTSMSKIGGLAKLDPHLIKKFDINKITKDFVSTIAKTRDVSAVMGQPLGDIKYAAAFKLGDTDVYTRVISPSNLKDIANTIEVHLDGLATYDNVVSFWADTYGARAANHKGFTGIKSEEKLKKIFGSTQVLGEDGKPTGETIPKFYDELGNGIELKDTYEVMVDGEKKTFLKDPTAFERNEKGIISITNDQIELFKAYNRDRILKAMNVKVDTFKNRERLANQAKQSKNVTASVLTIQDASGENMKYGYEQFASMSMINNLKLRGPGAKTGDEDSARDVNSLISEFRNNGLITGASVNNVKEQTFLSPNSDYNPVQLSSEISNIIKKSKINLPTASNNLIESPNAFVAAETEDGRIDLFFVGEAVIAENKSEYEIASGTDATSSQLNFNRKGQVVSEQFSYVDSTKYSKIYKEFYENSPQFRRIMQSRNFDANANNPVLGKNAYAKALLAYTKDINGTQQNK